MVSFLRHCMKSCVRFTYIFCWFHVHQLPCKRCLIHQFELWNDSPFSWMMNRWFDIGHTAASDYGQELFFSPLGTTASGIGDLNFRLRHVYSLSPTLFFGHISHEQKSTFHLTATYLAAILPPFFSKNGFVLTSTLTHACVVNQVEMILRWQHIACAPLYVI